jgi:hypothetical protein
VTPETWNLLLMGLPESGKSTYLGALFHGLKETPQDGLSLSAMPAERDYLIELERHWLALRPLERSRHHGPKAVELPLRDDGNNQAFRLLVPDIVGEDYEGAWEHGGWSEAVRETIRRADGILLFIRADAVDKATLIEVTFDGPRGSPTERRPWDPKDSPTQAKLSDLLEQVADAREGQMPPVAVVVAAWDAVSDTGLSPSAWLEWQTPLLAQWLRGQDPEVAHAVFAISAQGGDLGDEKVRRKLARHADKRPIPRGADPLTRPLRWLLEQRLA